jgi:hypothetical protein
MGQIAHSQTRERLARVTLEPVMGGREQRLVRATFLPTVRCWSSVAVYVFYIDALKVFIFSMEVEVVHVNSAPQVGAFFLTVSGRFCIRKIAQGGPIP